MASKKIKLTNKFNIVVQFGRDRGNESAIMSDGASLSEAVKEAVKWINHYLRLEAGMKVSGAKIEQACAKCNGTGKKPTKRKRFYSAPCLSCDGSGYPVTVMNLSGVLELPYHNTFEFISDKQEQATC